MAIIDGRTLAQKILAEIQVLVSSQNYPPCLAAVRIGNDPALEKFVDLKKKSAERAGIVFTSHGLPEDVSQKEAQDLIVTLSQDPAIQGIFIELPIPAHLDTRQLLDAIDSKKDVDVLSRTHEEQFYNGNSLILPPAVLALQTVLENEHVSVAHKKVAVFGRGRLIGKPISHWLKSQGAEVFEIDENTLAPEEYSRKADIVVSGVGKPDLITSDMIKENAIIIDFGYGRKGDAMVGDVTFSEVFQKASLITPVPGGMGPLVIAAVLKNLIVLSLIQTSGSRG